ncbi:MAG: hypothetical protein RL653_2018 [Pseudomonadota bacterium]|jgi:hypothetical protein
MEQEHGDEGETGTIIPLGQRRRAPGARLAEGNFTSCSCDGEPLTLQLRETFLPCPGACRAVGGDPRRAGPSVALARCGHVTTGWTSIMDDGSIAERLRIRCVEDDRGNDPNHLWGRLCDGPPGKPVQGDALRQCAFRPIVISRSDDVITHSDAS